MIGYLHKVIKPLVLILPKIRGYVETFKDENKHNKLMYLIIDHQKLLENYKAYFTKIADLRNIRLNVKDDRYITTKIRTYGDKVYTNFHDLNVSKDGVESESLKIISISFLLVYGNKYYPQV